MNAWIYIVLLGIAALLYALLLPKRREESAASDQLVKEMESTLEQYMGEIQLENEQLLQLVGQMKQEQEAKQSAQQEQLNEIRQRLLTTEQQLASVDQRLNIAEKSISSAVTEISAGASSAAAGEKAESQPVPSIKDRYHELFQMFEAGKSIDKIAKAVGMQRGEVQLIIQLAKQEESS